MTDKPRCYGAVTLKMIWEEIRALLLNREAGHKWSLFSYHELCPIRNRRPDIEDGGRARARAERATKGDRLPSAPTTRHAGLGFSQDRS